MGWGNSPFGTVLPWKQEVLNSALRGHFKNWAKVSSVGEGACHQIWHFNPWNLCGSGIELTSITCLASIPCPALHPCMHIYKNKCTINGPSMVADIFNPRAGEGGRSLGPYQEALFSEFKDPFCGQYPRNNTRTFGLRVDMQTLCLCIPHT